MKTKLFFLLLGLVILSSCDIETEDFISKHCPGSCTVISGKFTTDEANKPLPGVKLEVKWEDTQMWSSATSRKAIATTDANGNYELRFLIRDSELQDGIFTVNAHLNREKYLFCGNQDELEVYYELKRDTSLTFNYNLPQTAFIKVKAGNVQAIQRDDHFYTSLDFDGPCNAMLLWQHNVAEQTASVAANQEVIIRTYKKKAGIVTEQEEVVTLKPGATLNYQVTF